MKTLLNHAVIIITIFFCAFYSSSCAQIAPGLCISEIMFNPSGPEQTDEFIELYNCSDCMISLRGWSVSDGQGSDRIIDAGMGLNVPAHTFCLIVDPDCTIFPGSQSTESYPDILVVTIDGPTFGSRGLSNSCAETVSLLSESGTTISCVQYDPSISEGFSWEKVYLCNKNFSENWAASRVLGGTPGRQNSVSLQTAESSTMRISPNPFSPNADGHEDAASITYSLSLASPLVSIAIFDIYGRHIYTLLNSYQSGPEHTVTWDGTAQYGLLSDTGIYIVYLSAIDAKTGQKADMQSCVVISRQ